MCIYLLVQFTKTLLKVSSPHTHTHQKAKTNQMSWNQLELVSISASDPAQGQNWGVLYNPLCLKTPEPRLVWMNPEFCIIGGAYIKEIILVQCQELWVDSTNTSYIDICSYMIYMTTWMVKIMFMACVNYGEFFLISISYVMCLIRNYQSHSSCSWQKCQLSFYPH